VQDVKLQHAVSVQAAETVIAMCIRLYTEQQGSRLLYIAACYVGIGLAPLAVYFLESPKHTTASRDREEPAAEFKGESSGHELLRPLGPPPKLGNPAVWDKESVPDSPTTTFKPQQYVPFARTAGHDAPIFQNTCVSSSKELLQLVHDLVSAGFLSPFAISQQLESAVQQRLEGRGDGMADPCSSMSSSRSPSTRPSTSFSSSSMPTYDSASAGLLFSVVAHGSFDLLPPHLLKDHQQQHQQQQQAQHPHISLIQARPPSRSSSFSSASKDLSTTALQALPTADSAAQQLLLAEGKSRRPRRARTCASLLATHKREELPPIEEAAHEGIQQQQPPHSRQSLDSDEQPQQQLRHNHPHNHGISHKSWPPPEQLSIRSSRRCKADLLSTSIFASHRPSDEGVPSSLGEHGFDCRLAVILSLRNNNLSPCLSPHPFLI